MIDDTATRDFPGQLVIRSEHGHLFRHDPGAKSGKVYDEGGTRLLGSFLNVDAGDENTPTGIYVSGSGEGTNYTYADTYDGASAYLMGRGDYAAETMYAAGYRFTWDSEGDTAEAIPDTPEADPYGRATGTVSRQLEGFVVHATGAEDGFYAPSLDVCAGYLWGWHSARGTFDLPAPEGQEPRTLVDPDDLVIKSVRDTRHD